MEGGWVKLWRKSIKSRVFQNEGLWKIFTWCLMKANHSEVWVPVVTGKGQTEVKVGPGQFLYGRETAARELGMKESTVRDRMQKLQDVGCIAIQPDTQYSLVTIRNWDQYQTGKVETRQATDTHPTTKRQANDTNKNEKNEEKNTTAMRRQAEEIYETYPKKVDRNNTIKSICKLLESGVTADALLAAVAGYKADLERKGTTQDYWIHSKNFFGKAARWQEWRDGGQQNTRNAQPTGRAYRPFKEEPWVNRE